MRVGPACGVGRHQATAGDALRTETHDMEMAMSLLTREAILAAPDLPTESVSVPEWGGTVLVRGLTGTERDAFEAESFAARGKDVEINRVNLRARLVTRTIVDDAGKRVFTDQDIAILGSKSAAALDRVFEVSSRLSGLGARDVEDLAKNSDSGLAAGSTSGSPGNSA